tara:strand:+ start:28 stop:810 length:783 start_codon:yes stop_codon:yes gene_type:complete
MSNITVTYGPSVKGWTSFHSYIPEWMVGMNSNFYSFYQGKPWKHHTNAVRNQYYGAASVPSKVQFVFNNAPIETKMFKTIELEGTKSWKAEMTSDLHTGLIEASYFVPKEGVFYANTRRTVETGLGVDFSQISTQGLGDCSTLATIGNVLTINFAFPATVSLNPIVDIGDIAYFDDGTGTLAEIGAITGISESDVLGSGFIEITNPAATPVATNFIFAAKNSVAESYGLRGHYNDVTLTNTDTTVVELFAASSEIFKSYP